ncbi:collagen alpha-6 chain [Stylonychia lemnae]|uniref:Collagen alpha-6 chain n=1 Tax=Stylonychia lemnae TaxID=5949 RepID=A0A078BBQ7_STYLE|nr:collagen alpha-6 chain [Stylonychia lemnae]|eukprot:CDW91646.1 collagen alpha-6 chain [Stylonychia lemnae]
MLIRYLVLVLTILKLVNLQEIQSQICEQCSIQPCGCELFKCSQGPIYPENVEDLSRGFSGCQSQTEPFVNAVIIQKIQGTCLCPYVNVDKNCKPLDKSIKIGTGFQQLKVMKMGTDILEKIKPFLGHKEDSIKFIQESESLELLFNEIQALDLAYMSTEVSNLGIYYDNNTFASPSIYGSPNPQKPMFEELTRGIRTLFYSFQRQYGHPENYQKLWNYALGANYSQIMRELERESVYSNRKHIEAQILKYCLEKCSESYAANIMFVIDGSGSIDIQNYNIQKEFMVNLLETMKIEKNQQEVALILFSSKVELQSDFSTNKTNLTNTIRTMHHPQNQTFTDLALTESAKIFKRQIELRPNIINLLFILTDGQPTTTVKDQTIKNLKSLNVSTYAIGIGSQINNENLAQLSGENASDYSKVYYVSQFDQLKLLLNSIHQTACSTPTEIDIQTKNHSNIVLDDTGAQYFVLLQKYVYLRIDLSKYILQNDTTDGKKDKNTKSFTQNEIEMYYSFTEELPNQFVHDGKAYFAVKQTQETKSQVKMQVLPLVFYNCSANCESCLNQNICKICSEGFVLINDKCQKPSVFDNPYIAPIIGGVGVAIAALGGIFNFGGFFKSASIQIPSNAGQHQKQD